MKLIFVFLLLNSVQSHAGGVLACDDFGNQCILNNPSCDRLIPPIKYMEECQHHPQLTLNIPNGSYSENHRARNLSADVSCGEFKYMNSLRINLDLKKMAYELLLTLTPDQHDEFIRSGDIGSNPIKRGPYTIYRLIENGKTVGFLKAVDQETPLSHSSLIFTEQGWSNQLRCVVRPLN
ncbi:MAG: hypothetical protein ACAH59_05720 [Pseudobdellovibrionaceae bacterium]